MKINRLFLSMIAIAAIVAGCKDDNEDLGTPAISVSQTELSFSQTGGASNAQTVYVTSTRDWTASCSADWVIVSPTSASASSDAVEVTIYVDANTGTDRSATVTFATTTVQATVAVSQTGPNGVSNGSGTADDPYNVADALDIINNGTYTSSSVYVHGIVSAIDEIDTSYGNATYYISDDGETSTQLEVYRGYYLGGEKFTSEDQLNVGDDVIVYGQLTMFYSTPEINQGSYLTKVNDDVYEEPERGDVDLTDPYTTNVSWTAVEHAETNDVVIINDTEYDGVLKLGTGSYAGEAYCTLPAGTKSFVFYCLGWNNKSNVPYTVTIGSFSKDYTGNGNSGVNNNSPFTLDESTFTSGDYHVINLDSALSADTQLNFKTTNTSNGRVIVFGAKYFDTDQDDSNETNGGNEVGDLTGDGTVDNPYTIADCFAILNAGAESSDNVYITGIVSQIGDLNTSYGELSYYLSDDGTTTSDELMIYQGYGLNGEQITSTDYLTVGDVIVVSAVLKNYYGTFETNYGSTIYSINGETGDNNGGNTGEEEEKYVSNVTWESTSGTSAECNDKVIINNYEYDALKLGTSSKTAEGHCTLSAGSTKFVFYSLGWNGKSDVPFTVTVGSNDPISFTANGNTGIANSSPYTVNTDTLSDDTDYHEITFDALTADTTLTIETTSTSNPRIVVFGAKAE